jgi:PHD/YefM family antitoxin component YafN of YafNO toxin-antitoxin module
MSSEYMLSISEAQREMTRLPDQLTGEIQCITVTRYGKPVLSILPYHIHQALLEENLSFKEKIVSLQAKIESLQETLEVLRDEDLMQAIRQGVQEIAENKGESLDDVLKELGWE